MRAGDGGLRLEGPPTRRPRVGASPLLRLRKQTRPASSTVTPGVLVRAEAAALARQRYGDPETGCVSIGEPRERAMDRGRRAGAPHAASTIGRCPPCWSTRSLSSALVAEAAGPVSAPQPVPD